jgi:hypothetical protein
MLIFKHCKNNSKGGSKKVMFWIQLIVKWNPHNDVDIQGRGFFYEIHFMHELHCKACTAVEPGPEVPEIHRCQTKVFQLGPIYAFSVCLLNIIYTWARVCL